MPPTTRKALPRVSLETKYGEFVVELRSDVAPLSSADFLGYVDRSDGEPMTVYRIVELHNQPGATGRHIQFGRWPLDLASRPLPPVPHESTRVTGLTHRRGALSLARLEPGTGGGAYFICMDDKQLLDAGTSLGDGLGYAVFGSVIEGFDALERIQSCAESDHMLQRTIPIREARRIGAVLPDC